MYSLTPVQSLSRILKYWFYETMGFQLVHKLELISILITIGWTSRFSQDFRTDNLLTRFFFAFKLLFFKTKYGMHKVIDVRPTNG